ncbi:MAG: DUF6515 family protein [Gemmatimonadales bacterium]
MGTRSLLRHDAGLRRLRPTRWWLGCAALWLAMPHPLAAQSGRATPAGAHSTRPGSPAAIGVVAPGPAAAPDHEPRLRPGRSLTAGHAAPGAPNVARPPNVGGPGTRVPHLPGPFTRFRHGGRIYYYCLGDFYVGSSGAYEEVEPPIGAVVHTLPPDYETFELGGRTFYYHDGVFYAPGRRVGEYEVVRAPVGAVVAELPRGAVEIELAGRRLYVYRGVYYVSVQREGDRAWVVTVP